MRRVLPTGVRAPQPRVQEVRHPAGPVGVSRMVCPATGSQPPALRPWASFPPPRQVSGVCWSSAPPARDFAGRCHPLLRAPCSRRPRAGWAGLGHPGTRMSRPLSQKAADVLSRDRRGGPPQGHRGRGDSVQGPARPLGNRRVCCLLRGSQAPRRAVCGTRGSLRTMHGGGSAPSCCAFTHRVAFEEGHLHRIPRLSEAPWEVP